LSESLRIDKWLWHARFCKTRVLAQERCVKGHIRLNGHRIEKASAAVRIGDVMTLPSGGKIVSLKVLGLGLRRGPPSEAQVLYEVIQD
jgi:ribosome-associated heat shock protein Hsp15